MDLHNIRGGSHTLPTYSLYPKLQALMILVKIKYNENTRHNYVLRSCGQSYILLDSILLYVNLI